MNNYFDNLITQVYLYRDCVGIAFDRLCIAYNLYLVELMIG